MLRFLALRIRRRMAGSSLCRTRQKRIIAMIDAGESYTEISRALDVTAAEIDCTLRHQTRLGFEG